MLIVAGLGNPGHKYAKTRHNVGYEVIDELAKVCGIRMKERRFRGLTGSGYLEGQKVLLLKPETFMNLSGDSIAEAVQYYKADPTQDLIVISDDINLPLGALRLRRKGSAGGHNGLKHIISRLESDAFLRVRVGVGDRVSAEEDLVSHVLGHFNRDEKRQMAEATARAAEAVRCIAAEGIDRAMNKYN